ncbi:MAG: methyltransferase [Gammaproteobacteria bacterium]|nr:MAG: methyltransferase [Gammaproteobacteria bacterium]
MEKSNVYENVQDRYSQGAQQRQEALCCPVDYDQSLLTALPQEIIDKDYGCGDPSRYVREGDHVLDLGSGGGKICYMAAQLVGDQGHVTGVDMTDEMLTLSRKYKPEMAAALGSDRVTFHKGYIQDLALDVGATEQYLAEQPIKNAADLQALLRWQSEQRCNEPLIRDNSISLVISNCVLNLVAETDRKQMISEIYRVLAPGGRVAISDIVADERVPGELKDDPELWSGCISGAFQEADFLNAFVDAGFVAVAYDKWDSAPWQVVDGIEFRSVTLTAMKPVGDDDYDGGHALLYKGPYVQVKDDEGNVYYRGERMAVSKHTYDAQLGGAYNDDFIGFEPAQPLNNGPFRSPEGTRRAASVTKGGIHNASTQKNSCC